MTKPQYDLMDKYGRKVLTFNRTLEAAGFAKMVWPTEVQDPDRLGLGWDVQLVGVDRNGD